jgi:hypothetical protein
LVAAPIASSETPGQLLGVLLPGANARFRVDDRNHWTIDIRSRRLPTRRTESRSVVSTVLFSTASAQARSLDL